MIEPCEYDDVVDLLMRGRRELVLGSRRNVTWFRIGTEAVAGVRVLAGGRMRLVNCWVSPEARGKGYGLALTLHRIEHAKARGAKTIDVRAKRPWTYARLGFTIGRSYKCGVTHCELRLNHA